PVRNGATVGHEFLQIREEADGNVVYVALPSGQAETTFVMTASAPDSVTFENPRHDFPQRITYRLLSADRLAVRIEGVRDATPRQVDFPLRRVSSEALAAGGRRRARPTARGRRANGRRSPGDRRRAGVLARS